MVPQQLARRHGRSRTAALREQVRDCAHRQGAPGTPFAQPSPSDPGTRLNYRDASFTLQSFARDTAFDDGYGQWAPVGSYPDGASWCGALDMAGNVWEWMHDWYNDKYYSSSPAQNPQAPSSGAPYNCRVRRGGSWYEYAWGVRSAYRRGESPSSYRIHWVGFRCVVPASPSPSALSS
jgi:formylglycine-generating enzyme required for sulfatase activity